MEFKKIKLKAAWLGNSKGSELTLQAVKANELIYRGVAKEVIVEKPTKKTKPSTDATKTKAVEKPPINKMVSRPDRSK